MKNSILGLILSIVAFIALSVNSTSNANDDQNPTTVVGTFDSRAVAVAYIRSKQFGERMRGLQAELKAATKSGNQARVDELNSIGPQMQKTAHQQTFSAAPVGEIIELVVDQLPGVAKSAGVNAIVSKWVLAYSDENARFVDVTDQMAALFHPDEATLKVIMDIVKTEPMVLENHED